MQSETVDRLIISLENEQKVTGTLSPQKVEIALKTLRELYQELLDQQYN